jgi:hypothetical protein
MELITLIPALLCFCVSLRYGTHIAFRYVFLPVLLLVPTYFLWTLKPLPALNCVAAALLGLGAAMVLLDMPRWKITRTDVWMLVFVFTSAYTDYALGRSTQGAFALFGTITTGLVPYMAGKLLIEQTANRISTVRMYILLISYSSFLSAYEYVMKTNPYTYIWSHFYPGQWAIWRTQFRWGFGRVAGPFSQSELAGMMVFTAWLLALWMGRNNYQELESNPRTPILLQNGKRHIWILFVALFMTQARGPWIGAILAVSVAAIGRARKPLRRAVVVLAFFFLIGVPTYVFGKDYLSGPRKDYGTEKETAQYREELVSNYLPVAIKGGPWGWGTDFPRIGGQNSIDNEYLFVWIVQGYIGLTAFLLLFSETILALIKNAIGASSVRERHFVLTFIGIMTGLAFTLSTVFLGDQTYILLFLLIGWAQALQQPVVKHGEIGNEDVYRLGPRATNIRIYS